MLKTIDKRKIIIFLSVLMLPIIIPMLELLIKIIFEFGEYCGIMIHKILYGCYNI